MFTEKTGPRVIVSIVSFFLCLIFLSSCHKSSSSSDVKIVGGKLAGYTSYFVGLIEKSAISEDAEAWCGGSLIADRFVLTAAHCVADVSFPLQVIAGAYRNNEVSIDKRINVAAILYHQNYDSKTNENDIALLLLDSYKPETLPRPVKHVKANTDEYFPDMLKSLTVIGWGNTSSFGSLFEKELRYVETPIVPLDICKSAGADYEKVTEKQICTGNFELGGVDSCQGDSGGPLIAKNEQDESVLVGVVSWGLGCAQPKKPGVYTRVSSFKDWITDEINTYTSSSNVIDSDLLKEFLHGYCYEGFNHSQTYEEGRNFLRIDRTISLKEGFLLKDDETCKSQGIAPLKQCQFTTFKDEQMSVLLKPDMSQNLYAEVFCVNNSKTDQNWVAPAKVETQMTAICVDSSEIRNIIYNDTPSPNGVVIIDQAEYSFRDEYQGEVRNDAEKKVCKIQDSQFTFVRQKENGTGQEEFILIIESSLLGVNFKRIFKTEKRESPPEPGHKNPTEDETQQIVVTFNTSDRLSGDMTIRNLSKEDIFTWKLDCEQKYSLIDVYGEKYEPVAENKGFSHKFVYPVNINAAIRSGNEVGFKFKSELPLTDDMIDRCYMNSEAVTVEFVQ